LGVFEKPRELRVFAIPMHENRELTGNFRAKRLIPLELNDVLEIREAHYSLIANDFLMYQTAHDL
jgi:hypothetical protein